jgi:hypothetical protein
MFKINYQKVFGKGAIVLCLLVLGCAGISKKKAPEWVSDPYAAYNKAVYIAAVGYSSGRDGAEKNALTALMAIFGQSISSESKTRYSYSQALEQSGTVWAENSEIAQAVKTSVKMDTLVGAEIKDIWEDGEGTVYAVAALERAKTNLIYSEMIQQNLGIISKLTALSSADKQSFDGYARYQQAASFADANGVFLNVMKVISPASAAGEELKSGDDYRIEAAEIARSIPIAITVQNDKMDRVKGAFSQVLTAAGFRTGGNSSRYVLNAALNLEEASFDGNSYKWIRYAVDAALTDTSTGAVLFPYNITGREGHNSLAEAENRAIRTAEASIRDSFVKTLGNFLSQGAGK